MGLDQPWPKVTRFGPRADRSDSSRANAAGCRHNDLAAGDRHRHVGAGDTVGSDSRPVTTTCMGGPHCQSGSNGASSEPLASTRPTRNSMHQRKVAFRGPELQCWQLQLAHHEEEVVEHADPMHLECKMAHASPSRHVPIAIEEYLIQAITALVPSAAEHRSPVSSSPTWILNPRRGKKLLGSLHQA